MQVTSKGVIQTNHLDPPIGKLALTRFAKLLVSFTPFWNNRWYRSSKPDRQTKERGHVRQSEPLGPTRAQPSTTFGLNFSQPTFRIVSQGDRNTLRAISLAGRHYNFAVLVPQRNPFGVLPAAICWGFPRARNLSARRNPKP